MLSGQRFDYEQSGASVCEKEPHRALADLLYLRRPEDLTAEPELPVDRTSIAELFSHL